MTKVFEAMPLRASRRQRQHRIESVKRLDRSLLVHAEHRGVRWWIQIQSDHVGRLGLEFRIVAGHVTLQPMRLKTMLGPHPSYHHMTDAQCLAKLATAPVGRTVAGSAARRFQYTRLQLRGQRSRRLPAMPAVQAGQSLGPESPTPPGDEFIVAR